MARLPLPVLATAVDALALMWRHLVPAILLTVVITVPVEWAVDAAGLRRGGGAPLAFLLATLISVAATAWISAAYLRIVAVREVGGTVGLATALFEQLDCLPWLLMNLAAVTLALLAAMTVVGGILAAVVVTTVLPLGLLHNPGAVGLAILLLLVVVGGGGAVWIGSLAVRWSLVTPVVVLEGRRWGLERSSDLTRDRRWRCMQVMAVAGTVLTVPILLFLAVAVGAGGGAEMVHSFATGGGPATQALFGLTGLLFINTGYRLLTLLAGDDPNAVERETATATAGDDPALQPALHVVAIEPNRSNDAGAATDKATGVGGHEADEAAEPPAEAAADGDPDEDHELSHTPPYDHPADDLSTDRPEHR